MVENTYFEIVSRQNLFKMSNLFWKANKGKLMIFPLTFPGFFKLFKIPCHSSVFLINPDRGYPVQ